MHHPSNQSCSTRVTETFQGWDAGVLSQLPLFVQESFPFVLTRKSAIHVDVLLGLSDNLVRSKGFAASSEALEQAHLKKFHDAELKYYSMALWRRQSALRPVTAESKFGSFDDQDGYNGFFPSPHYLSTAWTEFMQKRSMARVDKLVKGVEGEVGLAVQARCSENWGILVSLDDSEETCGLTLGVNKFVPSW